MIYYFTFVIRRQGRNDHVGSHFHQEGVIYTLGRNDWGSHFPGGVIRDFDTGVFTPLVFSTSGGMGKESSVFYKRLADFLSTKRDMPYSRTMGWLRCRLNFALLRSAILCIRGSRSTRKNPLLETDINLASAESRLSPDPD